MRTDDTPLGCEDDFESIPELGTWKELIIVFLFMLPFGIATLFTMGMALLLNAVRLIPGRYWAFALVALAIVVYVMGCSTSAAL